MASGCSPGFRLGLGSAVTLRMYNAWFVPPSVNNTAPRQLGNINPLLLQGPTSPCQNSPNPTNFGMLSTGTSQERLTFPWILHSNSCSKLSRATAGNIPTGLSFAWLTCLEGSFKLKSAGPCNTLDQRRIWLPEEYNLKLCYNIDHFSLDRYRKLTEVAVLSFACNEQLRQRPDYAKLPKHCGPRPAESPMRTHELKCHSNPPAHANFTKPKLDMLVHPLLSKNTSLPNATHCFWLPFGKDSSKGHTKTFPCRFFPMSHVTFPNLELLYFWLPFGKDSSKRNFPLKFLPHTQYHNITRYRPPTRRHPKTISISTRSPPKAVPVARQEEPKTTRNFAVPTVPTLQPTQKLCPTNYLSRTNKTSRNCVRHPTRTSTRTTPGTAVKPTGNYYTATSAAANRAGSKHEPQTKQEPD